MITIKQIAESLNMSATTVSNVIHGKTKEVSQETIERVQRFLDEVEYVPNINARNLAQNQSNIIGIVLKTSGDRYSHILCDPFVSEMLGGIERVIRESGFYMMLYISEDIHEIINHIASWNVDGLLLFWMQDDDAIRVIRKVKKPVVYIDTFVDWDTIKKINKNYVNVGLTDHESVYKAVKWLIGMGHRRIGFLSEVNSGVNHQRYEGYLEALREAGIEPEDDLYFALKPTKNEIDASLDELSDKARNVTAVFCCSDNFAAMLMNACIKKGMNIPEDLSVMGFDDNQNGRLFRPALTTMRQEIEKKGVIAAEELIKMIHGETPKERQIILKSELVVRDSVKDISAR